VYNKLNMSQQCAAAAAQTKKTLGCIHRDITGRDRHMIFPLYPVLVRPCLAYCVQFWSPQFKKNMDRMERVQRTATKMLKDLEKLPCGERVKEVDLLCTQQKRVRKNFITVFEHLKGGYKEDGGSLFTRSHMKKKRDDRYKSHGVMFYLDIRKSFFTVRTMIHCNTIPRGVVESRLLEVFKMLLDRL